MNIISEKSHKTAQRVVCIYDFLAILPLAIPFVNSEHLATMGLINEVLGGDNWPSFSAIPLLFVQLLGVIGTGWTIWRWRNMSVKLGVFEGILRLFVALVLLMAFFELQQPLLAVFGVMDILLALPLIIIGKSLSTE
ncbi:MAG: hypothetical protein JKY14_05950 [Paraglaciecola sp.]|nr:hypothetical protein [Paraglaciecola sp.]